MKKQIAIVTILILGIIISVVLVQRQQIFKSKASQQLQNAFEITPADPQKTVSCSEGTCQTDTLDVQIKLQDIEALTR